MITPFGEGPKGSPFLPSSISLVTDTSVHAPTICSLADFCSATAMPDSARQRADGFNRHVSPHFIVGLLVFLTLFAREIFSDVFPIEQRVSNVALQLRATVGGRAS